MSGFKATVVVFLSLPVCLSLAQTGASTRTIFSSSHRFVVTGLPAADAAVLANWLDDAEQRFVEFTGLALPKFPGPALEFRQSADESTVEGRVTRAQGLVEEGLIQKIVVGDAARADQEDLLEALCWLLANRYIAARQEPAARRDQLAEAPDWLAVGIAQNLYPAQRERNAGIALARWREGEGAAPGDLLALAYLPQGRWTEKSWCGLLLDWWHSQAGARQRWELLFTALADGEAVDEARLAEWCGHASVDELASAWNSWLLREDGTIRARGGDTVDRFEELRELLVIDTRAYGLNATSGVPASLTMEQLLEHRSEPWMVALTGKLAFKFQWVALGQPQEFQALVHRYVVYLDGLVGRKGSFQTGLFSDAPSSSQLRRWLAQADARLEEFSGMANRRRSYVDGVEAAARGEPAALDPARKTYVDKVEERVVP